MTKSAWQELLFSCYSLHRISFQRKFIRLCRSSVLWPLETSTSQPSRPFGRLVQLAAVERKEMFRPAPPPAASNLTATVVSLRWQLKCYKCWGLCGKGAFMPSKPGSVVQFNENRMERYNMNLNPFWWPRGGRSLQHGSAPVRHTSGFRWAELMYLCLFTSFGLT